METVADRHRLAAFHNKESSTADELSSGKSMTLNDLEPPKIGVFSEFLRL